jgi:membrane carboxypeptidase/penicillin-binding protein
VIRAFINMMAEPGRRQGGSTITQQVAKNLLVGDAVTFERKIREIIVAARIETALSKQEILEIYLNSIYLGRSTWGVDLASQAYFGKPVRQVTLAEGAFLAGLTKGPAYYNPDKYRTRAHERLGYVLTRMREDDMITTEQMAAAEATRLSFVPLTRVRRTTGFHFVDHIGREAKAIASIDSLTATSYAVRSTIVPSLQRAAEAAVQEGLAQYEQNSGRVEFSGPETNIGDLIKRVAEDPDRDYTRPVWQQALQQTRMPLYDVHWDTAVVVEKVPVGGGFESIRVGLRDGRVLPLSTWGSRTRGMLGLHDVVYVKVVEGSKKQGARVELRSRPVAQSAAIVMESKTGRVLAMVGSFSYPLSQLNRATQSRRQPGSSLKPLTYLAALSSGLQPNTLVLDAPITFPPINGINRYTKARDWWSPRNYDSGYSGTMTLRRALERSRNVPTARLLNGGISVSPRESLAQICQLAIEAQLYSECDYYYPFILGAQPVRPIDLAAFYAAVANEGGRPTPHVIDSVEHDGRLVYKSKLPQKFLASTDRAAVFQLRSILQGVLAPYIAGKTGTSDEWNDAWFVGFSNDVTIAVWVGYDNAKGKRTLGAGQAGSRVALPIFDTIMHAVWKQYAPQTALVGPSPQAARHLIAMPIDSRSGQRINGSRHAFMEYFRLDDAGQIAETQYRLIARIPDEMIGIDGINGVPGGDPFAPPWAQRDFEGSPLERRDGTGRPFFARPRDSWRDNDHRYFDSRPRVFEPPPDEPPAVARPRPRRVDPNYYWGGRPGY